MTTVFTNIPAVPASLPVDLLSPPYAGPEILTFTTQLSALGWDVRPTSIYSYDVAYQVSLFQEAGELDNEIGILDAQTWIAAFTQDITPRFSPKFGGFGRPHLIAPLGQAAIPIVPGPPPTKTIPGAPVLAAAQAGNGSVALNWAAPANNGGAQITGYNIFQGTSSGGESGTPVNASPITNTSIAITGLTNGTKYYFTVKAINSVGSSGASNETSATPAANVPVPPVLVSATPSAGQVALVWNAPVNNGGSAITGYNVTMGTASGQESATPVNGSPIAGTSYTVTGLMNGTQYFFEIIAINAVGSSLDSNELSAIPSAPGAPVVTAISPSSGPTTGNTSVTITGSNLGNATLVLFGGVSAPFVVNPTVFLNDQFGRTVASGLGTAAPTGGAWTQAKKGAASNASVNSSEAVFVCGQASSTGAAASSSEIIEMQLGTSFADAEATWTVAWFDNISTLLSGAKYGGNNMCWVVHWTGNGGPNYDGVTSYYRLNSSWSNYNSSGLATQLSLRVQTADGSTFRVDVHTNIFPENDWGASVPGASAGNPLGGYRYNVRAQVQSNATGGPTFRMRIWKYGTAEPSNWQLTATDTAGVGPVAAGATGFRVSSDLSTSASGGSWNANLLAHSHLDNVVIGPIGGLGNLNPSLTATSPAQAAGTVDVTVQNPSGSSTASTVDQFTYGGAPAAPQGLTAVLSGSSVILSFTNDSTTQGNDIYRDGTTKTSQIAFPLSTPGAQTYTDLNPGVGTHTYYVSAYNGQGEGSQAGPVTITVPSSGGGGGGKPLLGFYTGALSGATGLATSIGVTLNGYSSYTDGSSYGAIAGYSPPSGLGSLVLMLGVNLCADGKGYSDTLSALGSYKTLATRLPAGTIVRLGWEFDIGTGVGGFGSGKSGVANKTVSGNNAALYANAFAQVVTSMRSGNAHLLYDWCGNAGSSSLTQLQAAYPGDGYVDYIGADHYDPGSGDISAFANTIQMAVNRGKPFSCGEWGLKATANNIAFMNNMALMLLNPTAASAQFKFASPYTVVYQSYFSVDESGYPDSDLRQSNNQQSVTVSGVTYPKGAFGDYGSKFA